MVLFKRKKVDQTASEVGGRSTKLLIAGIALGAFLVVYVMLNIGFLSKKVGTAFADYADYRRGPLNYDFESFEEIFPGRLDELRLELETTPPSVEATVTTTTTSTDASTSTDSAGDTELQGSGGEGEDSLDNATSSVDDEEVGV